MFKLKNVRVCDAIKKYRLGLHIHYKIVNEFLEPYGIDTVQFLESFGAELDLENCCEYKGKTESCDKVNE